MKTFKSVLPVVLLLAAIAALPLTRGVPLPFAAAAPQRQAGMGWGPPPLPGTCNFAGDNSCVTSGDITATYESAATCAPDDPAWDRVTPTTFYVRQAWESYLYPQHVESGAPNLTGESADRRPIAAAALHNGSDICLRMLWADATQDLAVDDLTKFADAVAIMIPFSGEDIDGKDFSGNVCPDSFHMGGFPGLVGGGFFPDGKPTLLPDCVQNIVQWRADQPANQMVRNMTAVGFSTSAVTSDSDALPLWTWSKWAGGNWEVIYKRPLAAASGNMVNLAPGHQYPIAFANWDGSQRERDGAKFVTEDYNNNLIISNVP